MGKGGREYYINGFYSLLTPFHFRFVVGIGVYFVMGMVIMRVKYNAAGTDLIPNKAFWKSLPGLIKVTKKRHCLGNTFSFG